MDLIHNLLKLTIISKSIFRQVEFCIVVQRLIIVDGKKCNCELTMLRCLVVDSEGSSKQLMALEMFCQQKNEGSVLEVGSSLMVGWVMGQGFENYIGQSSLGGM